MQLTNSPTHQLNYLKRARYFILLCMAWLTIMSGGSIKAQDFVPDSSHVDTLATSICGDLHGYTQNLQDRYASKQGGNSTDLPDEEDWNPNAVFQCGSFTVYYSDFDEDVLGGFADPSFGEARRTTFCEVLNYVESVIDIHPNANPVIGVDNSYFNSEGHYAPPETGFLANAGPFYSLESGHHFGVDAGIYDGFLSRHIQTGIDPDPNLDYDGRMQVNFHQTNVNSINNINYFNIDDGDPLPNLQKYDLYTVLLHEVSHILGMASALTEDADNGNVVCFYSGSNSFTRYDWSFGFYGNILNPSSFAPNKLTVGTEEAPVINSSVNSFDYPLRQANVWINSEGPPLNHNLLAGNPNQPGGASAVSLSHLGGFSIFNHRQQFSPGYNLDYLMQPFIVPQHLKRKWTLPEMRMLMDLGYGLDATFLNDNSLFPFNESEGYGTALNSEIVENHSPYRLDYNVYEKMLTPPVIFLEGFSELADFIEEEPADDTMVNSNTEVNSTQSTLQIDLTEDNTLFDADDDPITVYPNSVFGIRGVSQNGNNHDRLVLDESRQHFTFTPEPGFHGRAQFGFYLFDGKEIGAMEVYTIDVSLDETVSFDPSDEMIINGDFEDGIELRTWEEPEKFYTNQSSAMNTTGYHFGYPITGAHPYSRANAPRILHSEDRLPSFGPLRDNGFGWYGFIAVPSSTRGFPSTTTSDNRRYSQTFENNLSTLKTPVIQGNNYTLEFELGFIQYGSSQANVGDVLSNMSLQIIGQPSGYSDFTVYQEIELEILVEELLPLYTETEWQQVSIPFVYCGIEEAMYINIKENYGGDGQNFPVDIDNISLKKDIDPPLLSVDAGPDQYIGESCDNTEAQLNAMPTPIVCNLTYSWSPTSGLSDPNIANPIATPSSTTTYTVTVTNNNTGETAMDDVIVNVFDYDFTSDLNNPICDEEVVDLFDLVEPDFEDAEFITYSEDAEITDGHFFDPVLNGPGSYTIIYQLNQGSCLEGTVFVITVFDPAPDVLTIDAGSDQYIGETCDNTEAQLNATPALMACDISYSWSPTAGLSDPNIHNPIASPATTTTYTVTVTNNNTGESVMDDVTVHVFDYDFTNSGNILLCGTEVIDLFDHVEPDLDDAEFVSFTGAQFTDGHFFDPVLNGPGSYTIIYQLSQGSCLDGTAFSITVLDPSTATNPNGLTVTDGGPNDNTTLTGDLQFLDDLIIEDGANLTISNAQMQFAEGKGIHVMPGGKIFIENNSHITNLDCENHWLGIHVNGVHNITEYGSFADFHGQCTINNSTIENALTGVANFGNPYDSDFHGGLITCEGTTFKNCEVSVDLQNHQNFHPTLNYTYPIKCKFYNSTFLWDDDFQFISSIDNPMMRLQDVYRVTLSGCEFKNVNTQIFDYPNNSPHKSAIYARKASINMTKGCNGSPPYLFDPSGNCASGNVPSTVEGFNYGIVLHTGNESIISETGFKCYRGLWSTGSKSLKVTQNTFSDLPTNMLGMGSATSPYNPTWPVPYGVYFDYSTLFWFEGNTFNYPATNQEVGMFIKGTGASYHQIYDNNFWNANYGVVAYDDNRGLNGNSGLKIECNDFTNESFGVMSWSTISNPPPGWGISHFQGMPQTQFNPPFPAGNYFTNTASFDAYNTMEWVNYYTHPAENVTNAININLIQLPTPNECPSSFSSGLFEKELMAAGHKASADSVSDVLALIVDDGDSEGLTEEVILAQYGEAVELYYDLMQVSPNLSEEVMIEAINKEYELPAALLTLILNSNPHAAKSDRVQKELDERMQPLDEYQRAMIDEGLDLVSYKEELEARQSHHEGRYNSLLNQIIIETLADTTIGDKIAAVESKIAGYETVDHYYLIIDLYLQRGDVANAQNKLNAVATDFNLDPRRDAEYADFIDVYSIIFAKESNGDTTLTTTEFNLLETIAYRHSTLAAGLALTTLNYYADYDFLEVLVEPDTQGKSNRVKRNKVKQPEIKLCRVYPNPTAGILMIEIPDEFKDVNAILIDMQGRVVYQESKLNGLATLNFRKESSGPYQLQLKTDDGKLNEIHRIQIAK